MLDQIQMFIEQHMMASASMVAVILEVALRMFKSEKPLSILYGIAKVLKQVGSICISIGGFLDKVLPQKLK